MQNVAVIGAAYGDEGKGLVADALAARSPHALVVRFNGGAQAGHTVETPDGRRHVFGHVGAGTFPGAETFLSRFFVINPLLFVKEDRELRRLGVAPKVAVDPRALVTTPYDMLLNQWAERARGSDRHGSCGIGFGETIERSLVPGVRLRVEDLFAPAKVRDRLRAIRETWVPNRRRQLGVDSIGDRVLPDPGARLDGIEDAFLEAAEYLLARVTVAADRIRAASTVIFEGAQGLGLDQHRGAFPHVTRSCTGLRNVLRLARENDIHALNAVYVTRTYVTRHGAGPLRHELLRPPAGVVDRTNQPNRWQGSLRFAPLDAAALRTRISADLTDAERSDVEVRASIAVTCVDQLDPVGLVTSCGATRIPSAAAARRIAEEVGLHLALESRGPTRATIEHYDGPGERPKPRRPRRCKPRRQGNSSLARRGFAPVHLGAPAPAR